jgi:hypothetical protein
MLLAYTPTPRSASTMPGTRTPAAAGAASGCSLRIRSARRASSSAIVGGVRRAPLGVGVRRSARRCPSASNSADLMSVPPTSNASTAAPAPMVAGDGSL